MIGLLITIALMDQHITIINSTPPISVTQQAECLNINLTWEEIRNIGIGQATIEDFFNTSFGAPQKVLLPKGFKLYKLSDRIIDYNSLTIETFISPWWTPYDAFLDHPGYLSNMSIANANGISLREWVRLTCAVQENWSSLRYLQIVTLEKPVYAWYGSTKGVPRISTDSLSKRDSKAEKSGFTKRLPGGSKQLYIPNLTPDYITSCEHKET